VGHPSVPPISPRHEHQQAERGEPYGEHERRRRIDDDPAIPERFFCASENASVVPIPSLTSADAFDTGVASEALSPNS
jgi:hypothetical protein